MVGGVMEILLIVSFDGNQRRESLFLFNATTVPCSIQRPSNYKYKDLRGVFLIERWCRQIHHMCRFTFNSKSIERREK